jgi:hypothetical protein
MERRMVEQGKLSPSMTDCMLNNLKGEELNFNNPLWKSPIRGV